MAFVAEDFVQDVTWEVFDELKKPDLMALAVYLEIEVKHAMRKQVIKNTLIDRLVADDLLDEKCLENKVEILDSSDSAVKLKQLEIQKEIEMTRLEMEERIKLKEIEAKVQMEKDKLEKQGSSNFSDKFDATKNIRLVPKFQETEVDKYFLHFEKIAESLKWPKESWTLLLQSVFIGKAREIYSSLSIEQCHNYDVVKKAVLKAYELVPEAYRQKFRSAKKETNQTHVEFARVQEQMLDRWLSSKNVNNEFKQLRQLVLVEQFKSCIHADIRTHLDERDINNLEDAAITADDYALTHKLSTNNTGGHNKFSQYHKNNYNKPNQNKLSQNQNSTKEGNKQSGPSNQGSKGPSSEKPTKSWDGFKKSVTRDYCKEPGHTKSKCWKLMGKQLALQQQSAPTGCAVAMRSQVSFQAVKQKDLESEKIREDFEPFALEGSVSLESDKVDPKPIKIMRDTCCAQSMILEGSLPFSEVSATGENVLIQGIGMDIISVPLHKMNLKSDLVSGTVIVGVRPELPVKGVSMLLGNDLAGGKVLPQPIVTREPCTEAGNDDESSVVFPACAVTRSMTQKTMLEANSKDKGDDLVPNLDLEGTFMTELDEPGHLLSSGEKSSPKHSQDFKPMLNGDSDTDPLSHNKLVIEQENDPELKDLGQRALTLQEAEEVPVCFYKRNGVLMRKWRPPDAPATDEWQVIHQIVVPKVYHREVISIAHDSPMAGHLGIRKTHDRILNHFWWPTLRKDVSEYCRSCHTCQVVGKPNQKVPAAPLKPIPAFDEPFSRVIVDCVGPLPKTKSGNQYLLTIMCASTRFPEAIPLRNIKAKTIVKALTKFCTLVGLPKSIQSDQGSNFTSGLFQEVMYELGIEQYTSSAYHPESQGALERFHQTLKNMIKTYCFDFENDWDDGVHLLLFSAREAVQETLGFSPFELVFGHTVRGPLKLLKEKWLNDEIDTNLLDYVSKFKYRLNRANEIARDNLKEAQSKMKRWYDKDAKSRVFSPGDKVLVLFPIPGHPLRARYHGPYTVESKVGEVDYIVKTPDRRKSRQLCHINMLKEYVDRNDDGSVKPVCSVGPSNDSSHDDTPEMEVDQNDNSDDRQHEYPMKLQNSDVLAKLNEKLGHLSKNVQCELKQLIHEREDIFPDVPSRANAADHDVDVGDHEPIKQHPYRVNPLKRAHLNKEIEYMLKNNIIEPSKSEWSSPCILVPKPDGSFRFVTDYRKVNQCSKTDSYPIPRIDDCIDKIGNAKFVSKFDLLKGYRQVPLTDRAKEMSAFCTPDALYQYRVMPFGMKNAPATFQRMVNCIVADIEGCEAYVDDLIVYSQTWEQHIGQLRHLFKKLSQAKLTVNLVKSEFCQANIVYLGHEVGQGKVKPIKTKVEAIEKFPTPKTRKELQRFLGMAGYYRRFCQNFSDVASPLTNLLAKNVKYVWSEETENGFNKIKAILISEPVLIAPDFQKQFKLATDASDIGCGGVLMQVGEDGIDHPISYFSKKFDKHQRNYSTIEKECLALILALEHFDVYVGTTVHPVLVFTDHNPLTFIHRMKNKNQRLVRWSLTLQEYNLDIRHIKGKDNVMADALSRVG
ncbi:uncharacterized protein [Apostichopus japonicus]|uniref:uncharacterized protein n=1 Tax=Stichopus japonicus TaxID=307972 RepID=UPI003AB49CD2